MGRRVLVACCHAFGEPDQVLALETRELEGPRAGEVLVEMRAAPVNPADINVIQGRYGKRPDLPADVGNEGAGQVVALGEEVRGLTLGQWVRPRPGVGSWCEALITTPAELTPLPAGLSAEQAAMLCVNPAAAWRMLHDFVALQPGEWVVQNAATSAVGRLVIQLCRHLGLRTLNVVRRESAIPELRALGADQIVTEETKLGREVEKLTGGTRPRLALNGVGGPSALNLAQALAPSGTLVTYGAMGLAPVSLPNALLIFNDLRCVGFWVTAWYDAATPAQTAELLEALAELFRRGVLTQSVEARYSLAEARAAVAHAQREGRRGKVLLEM